MKKVLIFSLGYFPSHVGGAEVAIKEIVQRLPIDQYEFHLIANRYDSTLAKTDTVDGVTVHRIGLTTKEPTMADLRTWPLHLNKLIYQFAAFFKAWSLHRKHRFDATWSMMAHACGIPGALFKITHPSVKHLLTLQEGDPPAQIKRTMLPLYPLFVLAFRVPDMIQTISTFLKNWAVDMGYKGNIPVIPNAVNTSHFSQEYSAVELVQARRDIGKQDGDVFIVTTSRLVPKNGVNDVIESLVHLPKNVKFLIFGTGPDEEMLKQLATDQGVTDRVIFWGHIDHTVMPLYLKACDIFTRPSLSEGMGNSFVEAMAAELPVIATQEGGIADFLFDAQRNPESPTTGWAVDKQSPKQIAAAVTAIIENPDQVAQVVATAKQLAFEKYDWDLIAKDMHEQVFSKLLG